MVDIVLISGSSGAANAAAAPSQTWQFLTANAAANATTTLTTVMTTTGVAIGTYEFQYRVVYQAAATTTGVNFSVNYQGTVTRVRATRIGQAALTTAVNGINSQAITAVTGGCVQAWSNRSNAASLGPSAGVDTINVNEYETIHGLIVVSTSASLLLQHASGVAASTQVMQDTCLFLRRLA